MERGLVCSVSSARVCWPGSFGRCDWSTWSYTEIDGSCGLCIQHSVNNEFNVDAMCCGDGHIEFRALRSSRAASSDTDGVPHHCHPPNLPLEINPQGPSLRGWTPVASRPWRQLCLTPMNEGIMESRLTRYDGPAATAVPGRHTRLPNSSATVNDEDLAGLTS